MTNSSPRPEQCANTKRKFTKISPISRQQPPPSPISQQNPASRFSLACQNSQFQRLWGQLTIVLLQQVTKFQWLQQAMVSLLQQVAKFQWHQQAMVSSLLLVHSLKVNQSENRNKISLRFLNKGNLNIVRTQVMRTCLVFKRSAAVCLRNVQCFTA